MSNLQKILAGLAVVVVAGAGAYFGRDYLPTSSVLPAGGSQTQLHDAFAKAFEVKSGASSAEVKLAVDSPDGKFNAQIKLTGKSDSTANQFNPDFDFTIDLALSGASQGITAGGKAKIEMRKIGEDTYFQLSKVDLSETPAELRSQAEFFTNMFADTWYRLPASTVGLPAESAATAEQEAVLAELKKFFESNDILVVTENLGSKNGELSLSVKINKDTLQTFVADVLPKIAAASGQALPTEVDFTDPEFVKNLNDAEAVLTQVVSKFVIRIGESDGYIHGIDFAASADLAKLNLPDVPAGSVEGSFDIQLSSSSSEINQPQTITAPAGAVDFDPAMFGLGGLDTPPVEVEEDLSTEFDMPLDMPAETPFAN